MASPRDPETLKIPAFMRRRNLRSRLARPLLLTALDRKEMQKKLPRLARAPKKKLAKALVANAPLPMFFEPILDAPAPTRQKVLGRKVAVKSFRHSKLARPPTRESKPTSIGEITHYYQKIRVGVLKLSAELSVGDSIQYQTASGRCTQVVRSMEIDRTPVFTARRGDDVGIKLNEQPVENARVHKTY